MGSGRWDLDAGNIHNEGGFKGWALKIENFLSPNGYKRSKCHLGSKNLRFSMPSPYDARVWMLPASKSQRSAPYKKQVHWSFYGYELCECVCEGYAYCCPTPPPQLKVNSQKVGGRGWGVGVVLRQ